MFVLLLLTNALPLFGQTSPELSDDSLQLLPPYSELPPTFWEQHGTNVLIAAFVFAALVSFAVWRLLRPKPVVLIPPQVLARQALTPLLHRAEDGALLSNISQILRRYIITAFGLPPGEPTTAEFRRSMAANDNIGPDLSTALTDFLRQCDEWKFSPNHSTEALDAANRALKLIALAEARREHLRQLAAAPELSTSAART